LGLSEGGSLPILLPLRNVGAYLSTNFPSDDGTEGPAQLLGFLRAYLENERIAVSPDFFDADLEPGRSVILLDGMDEVGDSELRRRVARLIEAFARVYPHCRIVVTSRIVGYSGAARLGVGFATTTVRDFNLADVEQFLTHWHRLVAIGQMGPGADASHVAARQTQALMEAIRGNPRVRELAINPLMLTVIALVHRDRVKLPERRAELYAEAVDVLLGKWDEARGVEESHILDDRPFDTGDRRLLLQSLALRMQEAGLREIATDELNAHLQAAFLSMTGDAALARQAAERFVTVVQERTGLLVEAGQGVYRFSHLTFQEYLAAIEVAERDDFVTYTVAQTANDFWREVILLEAGYLSTRNRAKTTRLIEAIAHASSEPEPFHNLVLSAECLREVGANRVEGDVASALTQRLKQASDTPIPAQPSGWTSFLGRIIGTEARRRALLNRRVAAATALSRIETGRFGSHSPYWTEPHGEPDWVTVEAGEFWMGSDEGTPGAAVREHPAHRVWLDTFRLARVPVTNAQYKLYVQATGAETPRHWEDGYVPKDKDNHPVVYVNWHDALQYCAWLSEVTGQSVRLPSEAEWEKTARGVSDKRQYPWGDDFDLLKCNSWDLGLRDTTPVGIFPNGASPYGCLDMAGNVWEWTRSLWGEDGGQPSFVYPYDVADGREDLLAPDGVLRVLRGGAFHIPSDLVVRRFNAAPITS
ncbi:SUMF1/EgtB/PvdO family nonheme iron enzyme, partial [Candidatus Entotheonella palauensis]|uniref:SUMF1/EgtB/PvdO family nonheme iron enzyme n=1 Tax=Candidatus Entotheonella palauensis TaxID=93172 RepID=UPI0011779F70